MERIERELFQPNPLNHHTAAIGEPLKGATAKNRNAVYLLSVILSGAKDQMEWTDLRHPLGSFAPLRMTARMVFWLQHYMMRFRPPILSFGTQRI